jgi:LuxR family maltose regulon positive regulatory protein
LSVHTIKTHVKHLYAKLDAHSRREALKRAREVGLLSHSTRNR